MSTVIGRQERPYPEIAHIVSCGALKMEDRKMQDWILKDHLAGAMALSAVKYSVAQCNTASLLR